MLFDLRSAGRRRTVKVIYASLAILMGGGLVLFGIGSSGTGGLFDALGLTDSSSSGGNVDDRIEKAEKSAARRARLNPTDAAAWAALARARYQLSLGGDNFDQNNGAWTDKGKAKLRTAATAWEKYLALDPKHPDSNLATLMAKAFYSSDAALNKQDQPSLNEPGKCIPAMQIIVRVRPSTATYFDLAACSYAAGSFNLAELARKKSIALAPSAQRESVKAALSQINPLDDAPSKGKSGSSTGASSP
jgi:hypothetical protein